MSSLLAVDVGLKSGFALYGDDGRLCWYRSKNFGSAASLKRGVFSLLNSVPDLLFLVLEGSGTLAEIWVHEAERRKLPVTQINAEQWRQQLLYPREQKTGLKAKYHSDDLARRIEFEHGRSGSPDRSRLPESRVSRGDYAAVLRQAASHAVPE